MGFIANSHRKTIWLSILNGIIAEESAVPLDGFEPRTNKNNQVRYNRFHEAGVEGFITKVESYKREHNNKKFIGLNIFIEDGDFYACLDLPIKSSPCTRFLQLAENIDLTKMVSFHCFQNEKDKAVLFLRQEGTKVAPAYTIDKDGNGNMPAWKWDDVAEEWDSSEQRKFLLEKLKENFLPRLANVERPQQVVTPHAAAMSVQSPAPKVVSPLAKSLNDLITAPQMSALRTNIEKLKLNEDQFCTDQLGIQCKLHEISIESAGKLILITNDLLDAVKEELTDNDIPF